MLIHQHNCPVRAPFFRPAWLALALVLPLLALGQEKESVAVMDMEGRGISSIEAASLTDRMRTELVRTGAVNVVERGQMQAILAEQDFQLSGCTSDECAVEIGQLLGVTMMIAGTVGKIGSTYTLDLRTIDIETGAISSTMSRDYRGEIDGLITEIEHIAWELVGLVHPDELLAQLRDEPSGIDINQVGRTGRGQGQTPQLAPEDEKEKKGGRGVLWLALLAAAGGGAIYVFTVGVDGGGATIIEEPPEFPTPP